MKYRRVLLKLSGEALGGDGETVTVERVAQRATAIARVAQLGVEIGLVIGGGNLFRGRTRGQGMNAVTGDQVGMLATVMNALLMRDALHTAGVAARAFSALPVPGIIDAYDQQRVLEELEKGAVLLFAGGTGHPFFSTDSAAALRAVEIGAQLLLKATRVDGVYSADPLRDGSAVRYDALGYDQVLRERLAVMDMTAVCFCRDHALPVAVFDMDDPGALEGILQGDCRGTLIGSEEEKTA